MSVSRSIITASAVASLLPIVACSSRQPDPAAIDAERIAARNALAERAGAPLFDGMGNHHHEITTADPDAQRYFDQGLTIDFAFNHAESIRSFRAAQTLDPSCAMCAWGEALALGPNINVTSNGKAIMADEERVAAHAAVQKALEKMGAATERERDYIAALATRYNGDPSTERGMSQAPLKKGDGDPTSIVCRGQSTGMEDHRHEQESQNRDK